MNVVEGIVADLNMTDIREWVHQFCKNKVIRREIAFTLEADGLLLGSKLTQNINLQNFKQNIQSRLNELEKRLHQNFNGIICQEEITHWREKPHEILNSLIGCTAQCPFCGEQCDLFIHDVQDTKHRTDMHRLDCLAGWRYETTGIMDTRVCPVLVGSSDITFRQLPSETRYYTRDYEKVYPDWSITPNLGSDSVKYWKWFVIKFQHELAEKHLAKPPRIPLQWYNILWPDAEECLNKVCN